MPVASMEETQQKIGDFIAHLREQRGFTQQELAKRLKTSQSAVARMERGEQNFTAGMLVKISQALDRDILSFSNGALNFKINGGKKLHGSITVNASKNSAVAFLCAALLNEGKTLYKHMPRIEEVHRIIEVLESIGVKTRWIDNRDLEITPPKKLDLEAMDKAAAIKTRTVIMLIGPLIHLFKSFKLPQAGGCKLGSRTVRPHLYALENLGVDIKAIHDAYVVTHGKLHPNEIVLYESGDTATENALMAVAKIPGKTVIKYATSNYMVQDLCYLLMKMGVKIEGVGTSTLTVHGVSSINQNIVETVGEDPIEAMMFISLAATTGSSITIKNCPIEFLEIELLKLEKMGFKYEVLKRHLGQNGHTKLADILTHPSRLTALEEKIHPQPYPGLNIDNLPFFVPVATQAQGQTLIHDWVYETRAIYYMELNKLGANLVLADPHRVFINGPTVFKSAEVVCPPALRPAVIILIGMLAANGTSILRNVYSITRGYEDLCERLQTLGADISIMRGM